ncbi:DUF1727 domain-containing protein [Candidatus Daviesbacteria bacterium]|nr:DUF1727 domain-containing protein [Candidatus Daviesbacteria bacterium]
MISTTLAVLLGKAIGASTKKLNLGGGSAAPGLYALKLDPNLILNLTKSIQTNIVITGTNGKTTTARMLAHIAQKSGIKTIRNHTGSNLERGIASTLISGFGKKYELGIWELDEAAFNTVAPKLNPKIIVFLNAFRDQLDRYGEVDAVVENWCQTLKTLKRDTLVVVNGDDANTAKLKACFGGKVVMFGLEKNKLKGEKTSQKINGKVDIKAKNLKQNKFDTLCFNLDIKKQSVLAKLNFSGTYNVYNALAAIISASYLNISPQISVKYLQDVTPAFGRFEKLTINSKVCFIFLIKNPTGATEVFKTVSSQLKEKDSLLIALNDNLADGTDVSWIWDANFEIFRNSSRVQSREYTIYASGSRAQDLAVRIKYAGFKPEAITVENELNKALQQAAREKKGRLFIFPTYTAMLRLQKILAKSGIKKHYWEED